MNELVQARRDHPVSTFCPPAPELTLSLSPAEAERLRQAACDVFADRVGFAAQAQRLGAGLPAGLADCLRAFRRFGSVTGGLLIRGLPTFEVPATPPDPRLAVGPRLPAAGLLGIIAAVVGDMYGFRPELDGHLIQDIVPVAGFEETQQSVSSEAELYLHVELAFTDDRADHLALFCLRADHDPVAGTTLSASDGI